MASRAARNPEEGPLSASLRELIVFETEGCIYCGLFRRDVLPDYLRSKRAAELPIRFINVADARAIEPTLAAPLTTVPTIVLMSEGREVGRITGYTGPEAFFHMVNQLLATH